MGNSEFFPGRMIKAELIGQRVLLTSENGCTCYLHFLSDDIIRIRFATDGLYEPDHSFAIWSKFMSEEISLESKEFNDYFELKTKTIVFNISKVDLRFTITDKKGKIINRDEKGFHWEQNESHGGNYVKMGKVIQEGEHFYGMGDKTDHLNLRGKRVTNWAMDTYGFKKYEDPIYKAIPFYSAIQNGLAYGIFFDNSFKSYFDFGSERRNVASFWSDGGEMNYYFINGPKLLDVVRRYNRLTGVPELPPLWALGYHQSKWSYFPAEKVENVAQKFRSLDIPCDAIYFDIDYMDEYQCFTWDKKKFPKPQALISNLHDLGFKAVAILDPGIKIDENYKVFTEGIEQGYFCKRADGPLFKGKVWPGDCAFPDFTASKVRKWWSSLVQSFVETSGLDGIWNDMNEPAILESSTKTFPLDVRHEFDGQPCSHRKAHNVYGMLMAKSTLRGLKKSREALRPFNITRSAYAGAQRYGCTWTGDNIATWEHLWLATVQCQRLSISGFSFCGSDTGGFIDHPSPELFIRWNQLSVFHPLFRNHSSRDFGDQEPWCFGEEALQIVRSTIELRYRLLPYLYTAFYQYVVEYTPIIKPLSHYDQDDLDTLYRTDEFLLGDHLLVCPVLEPNARSRYVYLPKGNWYHFHTNIMYKGGSEISIDAPLQFIPVFVKAGAVLPLQEVEQYVGQKNKKKLTLRIYFSESTEESFLYEDSGDGYDYGKGMYNIKKFETTYENGRFTIRQHKKGHYEETYDYMDIEVIGLTNKPITINVNSIEHQYEWKDGKLTFTVQSQSFLHAMISIKE